MSKLESVAFSNDTVRRRIEEMSEEIADQVYSEITSSEFGFGIQIDELIDVANFSQLLVDTQIISS